MLCRIPIEDLHVKLILDAYVGVELHNKTLFNGVCLAKIGDNQKIILQSLYCYLIIPW